MIVPPFGLDPALSRTEVNNVVALVNRLPNKARKSRSLVGLEALLVMTNN